MTVPTAADLDGALGLTAADHRPAMSRYSGFAPLGGGGGGRDHTLVGLPGCGGWSVLFTAPPTGPNPSPMSSARPRATPRRRPARCRTERPLLAGRDGPARGEWYGATELYQLSTQPTAVSWVWRDERISTQSSWIARVIP
jgi:hypothetical protein